MAPGDFLHPGFTRITTTIAGFFVRMKDDPVFFSIEGFKEPVVTWGKNSISNRFSKNRFCRFRPLSRVK